MRPVQTTAMRTYQHLLAAQPLTAGKVSFAWTLAAGPALGRAGAPRWSEDGTLVVRARDAAWLREIRRARPVIVERLAQLLGPDAVQRIVIE
jgi:hypothetical protein